MGLTPKQRAFVDEYVVDHNATQAAIRAGYSVGHAKHQGYRLLRDNTEVSQAIEKLDDEQRERSGISRDWVVDRLVEVVEMSMRGEPRTDRNGRLVTVQLEGETVTVMDKSLASTNKALEQLAKHLGMNVARREVAVTDNVVYTLHLDRDLEAEGEQ